MGKKWTGKNILFHCDNMAIVYTLNKGSCKCEKTMSLVRSLFFIAAQFQFDFKVTYVSSVKNTLADPLSRLDMKTFRMFAPGAEKNPVTLSLSDVQRKFHNFVTV